jgi:hypothetical protein
MPCVELSVPRRFQRALKVVAVMAIAGAWAAWFGPRPEFLPRVVSVDGPPSRRGRKGADFLARSRREHRARRKDRGGTARAVTRIFVKSVHALYAPEDDVASDLTAMAGGKVEKAR